MIKNLSYRRGLIFWSLFVLLNQAIFSEERSAHFKSSKNSTVTVEPSKEIRYPQASELSPKPDTQAPLNEEKSLPSNAYADQLPPGWFLRLDSSSNTSWIQEKAQELQLEFAFEGRIWQQESPSGWHYWIGPLTSKGIKAFLKALQQERSLSDLSLKLVKVN